MNKGRQTGSTEEAAGAAACAVAPGVAALPPVALRAVRRAAVLLDPQWFWNPRYLSAMVLLPVSVAVRFGCDPLHADRRHAAPIAAGLLAVLGAWLVACLVRVWHARMAFQRRTGTTPGTLPRDDPQRLTCQGDAAELEWVLVKWDRQAGRRLSVTLWPRERVVKAALALGLLTLFGRDLLDDWTIGFAPVALVLWLLIYARARWHDWEQLVVEDGWLYLRPGPNWRRCEGPGAIELRGASIFVRFDAGELEVINEAGARWLLRLETIPDCHRAVTTLLATAAVSAAPGAGGVGE